MTAGRLTRPPTGSRSARSTCSNGYLAVDMVGSDPLDRHPEPRHHVRAECGVGGGKVRGHRGFCDVHAAAAHQHVGSGRLLELDPQPDGLVRQSRVAGIEVVAPIGPGPAVGRGRRIAHPSSFQYGHPTAVLRGRPRGEHAHDAAADDDEIEQLARRPGALGHRILPPGETAKASSARSGCTLPGSAVCSRRGSPLVDPHSIPGCRANADRARIECCRTEAGSFPRPPSPVVDSRRSKREYLMSRPVYLIGER